MRFRPLFFPLSQMTLIPVVKHMGTCSCYQLSIRAWLGKTNRSTKKYFFSKSFPYLPFDLFLIFPPCDQSELTFIRLHMLS